MPMFDDLIGAQLIEFDGSHFKTKDKNGTTSTFVFEEDEGDCCGWNELENTLLISDDELARNPVITKVEHQNEDDWEDGEHVIITLFGEVKKLAQIDSISSSGSGWSYGACVTVKCIQTGEEECITSW